MTSRKPLRILGPVAWVSGAVAALIYALHQKPMEVLLPLGNANQPFGHRQTLLWLVFEHYLPIAAIGVVVLIMAGRLGRSLGLPGLFRDPPKLDLGEEARRRKRPGYLYSRGTLTAFLGALGGTFLVAEVWTVIYYKEIIENLPELNHDHILEPPNFHQFFRGRHFWSHGDLLWFLLVSGSPFLGLLLLAEFFPATAPGMERRGADFFKEAVRFVLGVITGVFTVYALASLGTLLHSSSDAAWGEWLYPFFSRLRTPLGPLLKIEEMYPSRTLDDTRVKVTVMASFSLFTVMVFVFYLGLATLRKRLSPGLGICMVLSFAVLIYSLLTMLSTVGQVLFILVVFGWLALFNGDRYKYRFPGMGAYYAEGGHVKKEDLVEAMKAPAAGLGLLDNLKVLDHWRGATGEPLPKLVLVATTGGAYRAAFWTALVLDELGRHMGRDFHRHVRLITGASGGMVGAAYYVASFSEDGPPAGDVTDLLRDETGLDSLTPVARRLVLRDLPLGFLWPFPQDHDRGVELEREWATLARTFPDLCRGEEAGWRPSLIVSPMIIESGRRLLISNLDLGGLAETRPLNPVALPDQPPLAAEAARIYSSSAVEFFRVFPRARPTFKLQTGVRMSATFPLASPAVSLPTVPPRRVVDAGYYDNYGIDLATSWAYEYQDWIRENTSGVALIQIRAYPSEDEIQTYFGLAGARPPGPLSRFLGRVEASLQGLTSPLYGGLSAREWSMRFRNALQVRALDDLFNRNGRRKFFETFVFENFTEFAMNWFITDQDIVSMRHSIGAPDAEGPSDPRAGRPVAATDSDLARTHAAQEMVKNSNLEMKDRLAAWWEGRG